MLAAPTRAHQAFQHPLPRLLSPLMHRQSPQRNNTFFGRGVFMFVSHGAKLLTQMIASSMTKRADVK